MNADVLAGAVDVCCLNLSCNGTIMATDRFLRANGRRFVGLEQNEHGGDEQPFCFVQLADTQLGMEADFDRSLRGWDKEIRLMKRATEEVNRIRPAFVIVCGDLVNQFPAEERGRNNVDEQRRAAQVQDFKEVMGTIDEDIPLLCVCGNHDIGNRPNALTIAKYKEDFGDDYFSFWCHGVKCLVVNSQLWKDDSDSLEFRKAMDCWLSGELDDSEQSAPKRPRISDDQENVTTTKGKRRMLMFSHIAPFCYSADEPDGYFNLNRSLREELLPRLAAAGVQAWFCGHYHRNAGGVYRSPDGRELEVVVSAAVGTQLLDKPGANKLELEGIGGYDVGEHVSGLRVVNVLQDRVEHEWRTFKEFATAAASTDAS